MLERNGFFDCYCFWKEAVAGVSFPDLDVDIDIAVCNEVVVGLGNQVYYN
jgi:hypothetical protein